MENAVFDDNIVEALKPSALRLHEVSYSPSLLRSRVNSLTPNPNEKTPRYIQIPEKGYFIEFEGGMGRVVKMKDTKLDRFVAVKRSLYNSKEAYDEAKELAKLNHENILKVHDLAISDPDQNGETSLYFVSEWVEGKKMSDIESGLKVKTAIKLLRQVGSAVEYINSQNKVHTDLKDNDIIVNKLGNAIVLDFGLLKKLKFGRGNVGMGTPAWAPPEQVSCGEVSLSTDSYHFGGLILKVFFVDSVLDSKLEAVRLELLNNPDFRLQPRPQYLEFFKQNSNLLKSLTAMLKKSQDPSPKKRYLSTSDLNKDLAPIFQKMAV